MKNKVVIFCQYSQQPPYNTMLRYHNWGKELFIRGYDVSIVAANVVHNTTIDVVEKIGKCEDIVDGIHYHYIKTRTYSGNGINRLLNMHDYCVGIKKIKKKFNNPDYIIVCGAYVYSYVKKAFKNRQIITDIVDLWPLSIVQYAGFSNSNPLIKYLYHIEKKAYVNCDALIFSMEGGIDYVKEQRYSKRVLMDKIFHINMGIDISANDFNKIAYSSSLPWNSDEFNLGYCGSIRRANNVMQICEAALDLKNKGYCDIHFHIYGNGDELEDLEKFCAENDLKNMHFYGRIEKTKIPFLLSETKANIITYKQVDLMKYGGSQSKLFDYLAAGRPLICNAVFGYNLIDRYDCGIVTKHQDSDSLSAAIEALYKMDKQTIETMGKNARKVAELYDQPVLVDKLEKVFNYLQKAK